MSVAENGHHQIMTAESLHAYNEYTYMYVRIYILMLDGLDFF